MLITIRSNEINFRIVAVTVPHQYKSIARKNTIKYLLAVILIIAQAIPIVLLASNFIDFEHIPPPKRLGCSLVLMKKSYHVYFSLFFVVTIGINLIFLVTYLVLHHNFKSIINTTAEMVTLKRGALIITSLTAGSYFCGYSPLTVVYIILCSTPDLLTDLQPPYNLALDFVVRFMPHLNSCILPLFLVSGKTMERLKLAAYITNKSFRKYNVQVKYLSNTGDRKSVEIKMIKRK